MEYFHRLEVLSSASVSRTVRSPWLRIRQLSDDVGLRDYRFLPADLEMSYNKLAVPETFHLLNGCVVP